MVSGIGEMFASAIVKEVSKKLGSATWQEISQQWNFHEDLKKMKDTFATVQAVLRVAESQSLKQEPVRLWLKKLKSAAYDIADLLCEFEAVNRPKNGSRHLNKVKAFFSSSNQVFLQISMAQRMKSLRERLDFIAKGRKAFDLKLNASSFNSLDDKVIKKRETFSDIDLGHQTTIVGRDEEKEKIITSLLETEGKEDNISIIPIYGLGGIGKTTLAQLVFNDERIEKSFSLRAWVYVSMEFDLLTIGKAMISQTNTRHGVVDNLESVRTSLKSALDDNKYLVILDDLWEEDGQQLEKLKQMLGGGMRGSKIVVTTRSHNVAIRIASRNVVPYNLTGLSDEDCWSVFSQRAFRSGHEETGAKAIKFKSCHVDQWRSARSA